jgi:peptidoglycan-associated lipoprotein
MRRIALLALIASSFALTACPPKPKNGECKSSEDCASQEGYGKVCVQGRCQECGQDADCKAGFVCRDNKCAPKPQCDASTPCPAGQECVSERCVEKAVTPVTPEPTPAVGPECSDPAAFTIHFDFDKSVVRPDGQATLQKLADCLKGAPAKSLTASGYADERGTEQYNIALSARRAESAKKYLGDLGVSAPVQTVGNGVEGPVCREHNEACWSKNRRVEFQIAR